MTDPVTPNKAFAQPTRGSDSGTWDTPLNANASALDSLLGGGYAVALTGTDVTLSQTQANNLYFNLTGTLTGNRNLIFPAIGGLFIINNQTTGAFSVTVKTSAGGSTGVVVPQGAVSMVYLDGTNAKAPSTNIPSGTSMLFLQASAPAGWTQVTTYNDYALRVVSGTGGGATGSVGLSAFLAAGTSNHTLTINEIPAHNHVATDSGHQHTYQTVTGGTVSAGSGYQGAYIGTYQAVSGYGYANINVQYTGASGAHNHLFPALAYLDLINCTKN